MFNLRFYRAPETQGIINWFASHVELFGVSITQIWQFGTLADLAKTLPPLGTFLRIFEYFKIIHHVHVHIFFNGLYLFALTLVLTFFVRFSLSLSDHFHFHCHCQIISTFTFLVIFSLSLSDNFYFFVRSFPLSLSLSDNFHFHFLGQIFTFG